MEQFDFIQDLIKRYPSLQQCKDDLFEAFNLLRDCYSNGGKLLVAGNGGSAADSEHIVGELMKEFKMKRKIYESHAESMKNIDSERGEILAKHLQGALPAISLVGESALMTAYMNDSEPLLVFAQQIYGLGCKNDVFFAISTSGNSENILYAAVAAKAKRLKVIGLTIILKTKCSHNIKRSVTFAKTKRSFSKVFYP